MRSWDYAHKPLFLEGAGTEYSSPAAHRRRLRIADGFRIESYTMKLAVYFAFPSGIVALMLLVSPVCAEKQELTVKIIDRQDHETHYTYFVPGYSSAIANTNVNWLGTDSTVNCTGTKGDRHGRSRACRVV